MNEKLSRKNWDTGIMPSFIIFLAEAAILAAAFVLSYRAHGEAGIWIGLLGIVLLMAAIIGIVLSVKAIRKRSEPAGLIRLLCVLHIVQVMLVIGLYALGITVLLSA